MLMMYHDYYLFFSKKIEYYCIVKKITLPFPEHIHVVAYSNRLDQDPICLTLAEVQSNFDISKLMRLFLTSSNDPKCKLNFG